MSAKKKSPIPAERIAQYERLLATLPGVERKGADNSPAAKATEDEKHKGARSEREWS